MSASDGSNQDARRTTIIAALVVFGAVIVGAVLVVLLSGDGDGDGSSATTTSIVVGPDGEELPAYERPSSLPEPGSGRAPEDSGDPGGWEQGLLFGLLAVALLGIGVAIFRGGRRAQAGRARWREAAEPGREEARRAASPSYRPDPSDPSDPSNPSNPDHETGS